MTTITFNLLDAINREGIENYIWGLCKDIENTAIHQRMRKIDKEK